MSAAWQAALLALALLSGVCAGAVIVLARRVTTIQRLRASGFAALSSDEAAVRIELKLASTHPTLVVFLTDTCAACQGIVPALNALSQTLEHGEVPLSAHALVAGDREGFIHRNALTMAALQAEAESYRRLGVTATPESVLYDRSGTVIARAHPLNTAQLADFLESALGYRPLDPMPDRAENGTGADPVKRFISQPTLARGSEPQSKEGDQYE